MSSGSWDVEDAASLESVEQEVEVDEAGVGRPARERLLCFVGAGSGEESAEAVEGADVAAREDAEASEPAEQDVVGAPGSDSTQLQQSRAGARVVGLF